MVQVRFEVVGAGAKNGPKAALLELHFGPNIVDDSYEKPKVMACCEPFEAAAIWQAPEHHRACFHDLVENGCSSIPGRLHAFKDDPSVPLLARPQIESLAGWFADHTQDCYNEFWKASGASTYVPDNALFPDDAHTWVLPGEAETLNLKDIEVDLQNGIYSNPFLPAAVEDRILCDSAKDNDGFLFVAADPDPPLVVELLDGDVEIDGIYDSSAISGSADLASAATLCSVCSFFSFTASPIDGGPRMDALALESEDPADVRWTPDEVIRVDRFRIALYDAVHAPRVASNHWQIPVGAAHFLVSAFGAGGSGALSVHNSTAIDIHYATANARYEIDAFELGYVDSEHETWTISVSATAWD